MNAVELYQNKDIDLQRLLWNNDPRKVTGRRSGTTFSLVFYIAGHAIWDSPNSNYLIIGRHRDLVRDTLYKEIFELLRHKGFNIEVINKNYFFRVVETNQLFLFSTPEQWFHDSRGYSFKEAFIDSPRSLFDHNELSFLHVIAQKVFKVE